MSGDDSGEIRRQYDNYSDALAVDAFAEAEVAAKQMVTLVLQRPDNEKFDVSQALINLAAAQQLGGDLDTAMLNYQAAVDNIESQGDLLSQHLVSPLRGLAAAQADRDGPVVAVRTLDRALHISNVNSGPHSSQQVPILESMLQISLEHGDDASAKNMLERIYTLALREYSLGAEELLPTLMYKARVENQLGMQLAERETYRQIIKITSRTRGAEDFSLIEPYLKIGRTYVYDAAGESYRSLPTAPTAEWYFKKAVRIAESSPDSNIRTRSACLLSLADYYTVVGVEGKADSLYRYTWKLLSADDSMHAQRDADLSQLRPLAFRRPHNYANFGYKSDIHESSPDELLTGVLTVSYTIEKDGTTTAIEIIEADPAGFEPMELRVRQAVKKFVFRPRYIDGEATEAADQHYRHEYFYRLSDLPDAVSKARDGATGKAPQIH